MALTTDATNAPYIHYSGTMAEVLAAVKAFSKSSIIWLGYNGTNISCVIFRAVTP